MAPENEIDKWRLDRVPSKSERIVSVVASLLLTVLCAAIFVLVFVYRASLDSSVPVLGGLGVATIVFLTLALRAAFGEGKKLSPTAVKSIGYVSVVGGIFLVLVGLLSGPDFMALSVGSTGIGAGILNVSLGSKTQ